MCWCVICEMVGSASTLILHFVIGIFLLSECFSQPLAANFTQKLIYDLGACVIRINERCNNNDLKFRLYNSVNSINGRDLHMTSPDAGPDFDPYLPMKVVIHGYDDDSPAKSHLDKIISAYMAKGDYNVIYVDWFKLASSPCVYGASVNIPHVGACVAQLLLALHWTYPGFEPEKVHAIGHSMGANVAAHASGVIDHLKGVRFHRITGLDPATQLVSGFSLSKNLDAGDAGFVDIIHTNAGVLGSVSALGHVDIYVNGGTFQPRCSSSLTKPFGRFECSHTRSPTLYAESVNTEVGFWSVKCASLYHALTSQCPNYETQPRALMGDPCPRDTRGKFNVKTASTPPYALGYY